MPPGLSSVFKSRIVGTEAICTSFWRSRAVPQKSGVSLGDFDLANPVSSLVAESS